MTLVNNEEEAAKLWPYPGSEVEARCIPKRYPCLMQYVSIDDGVGGGAYMLQLINIPPWADEGRALGAFVEGVNASIQTIGPI